MKILGTRVILRLIDCEMLKFKNTFTNLRFWLFKNKLKQQQKDKVKKFIALTQTGEQTAIFCLQNNDWKLDLASDNYFQNPTLYYRELRVLYL